MEAKRARHLRDQHVPEIVVPKVGSVADTDRRKRRKAIQRRHTTADSAFYHTDANAPVRNQGTEIEMVRRLKIECLCKAVQSEDDEDNLEPKHGPAGFGRRLAWALSTSPTEEEDEKGDKGQDHEERIDTHS